MATTVLLCQNSPAHLWTAASPQWYLSILIRDDRHNACLLCILYCTLFLPFRSSVHAAHTAVSSVLYAVDEGQTCLHGQNVSQLFLIEFDAQMLLKIHLLLSTVSLINKKRQNSQSFKMTDSQVEYVMMASAKVKMFRLIY